MELAAPHKCMAETRGRGRREFVGRALAGRVADACVQKSWCRAPGAQCSVSQKEPGAPPPPPGPPPRTAGRVGAGGGAAAPASDTPALKLCMLSADERYLAALSSMYIMLPEPTCVRGVLDVPTSHPCAGLKLGVPDCEMAQLTRTGTACGKDAAGGERTDASLGRAPAARRGGVPQVCGLPLSLGTLSTSGMTLALVV
jgi:hypothetical protein